MTWISGFPSIVTAGTTVTWEDSSTTVGFDQNATSSDWTLTYYLRTNTASEGATVVGSAYNDGWRFTLASSVSTNFDKGDWIWAAVVTKASESFQLATGRFKVKESLTYSGTPTALDNRSQNRIDLDNVIAAIRSIIEDKAKSYQIGGRTFTRIDLPDLYQQRDHLSGVVMREEVAEKVSQGLGNPSRFFVRF